MLLRIGDEPDPISVVAGSPAEPGSPIPLTGMGSRLFGNQIPPKHRDVRPH